MGIEWGVSCAREDRFGHVIEKNGGPDTIRTCDLCLRRVKIWVCTNLLIMPEGRECCADLPFLVCRYLFPIARF